MQQPVNARVLEYIKANNICQNQLADQIEQIGCITWGCGSTSTMVLNEEEKEHRAYMRAAVAFYRLRAAGLAITTADDEIGTRPEFASKYMHSIGTTMRRFEQRATAKQLAELKMALDFTYFMVPLVLRALQGRCISMN